MSAVVSRSSRVGKKYRADVSEGNRKKSIHFGQAGAEDFTQHQDPERRARYLARHAPREDWDDPFTSGFWSARMLWSFPTISQALEAIEGLFGIDIDNRI